MQVTLFATRHYARDVSRLLTAAERAAMEQAIAAAPEANPVVPGTGGVRKVRWGRQAKGKRGGVRVIYYYWSPDNEVYLIAVYAKSEKADLTVEDRRAARFFVEVLKSEKTGRN